DRTVGAARDRRTEPEQSRLARHVELPTDPDEREVQAHEQPIAEVVRARRIRAPRAAIEVGQDRLAATIAHFEQRDRAARRRAQYHEVRGSVDAPTRVAGRAVEIHDDGVGGMGGVELQLDSTLELFIRAAQHVFPRVDDDPSDLGASGRGGERDDGEGERDTCLHRGAYVTRWMRSAWSSDTYRLPSRPIARSTGRPTMRSP